MVNDKVLHFAAGFALAAIFGYLFSPGIGLAVAVAAGIAKELYDLTGRGTPDIQDAIVTAFGGGVACALLVALT